MSGRAIPHSRPLHDEKDVDAAADVLRSQMTASGRHGIELARLLETAFDGESACTTASGTLALVTALAAFDVGPGDEVVIPTYVCPEVLDAVRYVGARPVLCDIDATTYAPSLSTIAAVLKRTCKAVIVPHMFGIPAAVDEIKRVKVPIIEDLAQGLGATLKGRRAGAWGDACVLSFKAIKMVSAGEGGAAVIRDRAAAERLSALHTRQDARRPAFEFPMSDVTAAVARVQWRRLGEFVKRRNYLARRYRKGLSDLAVDGVGLPLHRPGCAWFRYPVTLPSSMSVGSVRDALAREGIQVRQPVNNLLHRQLGQSPRRFPIAERAFNSTVSLPLYPALSDGDQDRVTEALRRLFKA